MAGEIVVLQGTTSERYDLLFWYSIPLASRKTVGNSATLVVCCPSSSLPDPAATVLDAAKKQALDDGTALFKTMSNVDMTGYSPAQAAARAQALYNDSTYQADILAAYEAVYEHYGTVLDGG